MTGPHEADAFVGFHADTGPVYNEAERGINRAAERLEDKDLKKIGHDFGETVSKSMGDEFEKQGPALGKSIEKGLSRQKVRTKVNVVFDKDNNVIKRTVETITDDIQEAFNKAGRSGGPIDKFGQGISDAIGNAFNVSGRSPLIAFLVPLFGTIGGLILAAVQAVNALIAVLAIVPSLLAAIGLQVGVLFIAFNGLGAAIQGAFAAKNAKELHEAIKSLSPAAQQFVKDLLPLRQFFKDLSFFVQQSFFSNLGRVIPQLQAALGPTLLNGLNQLAKSMGLVFKGLADFLSSPSFVTFVRQVFPATILFLRDFGPAFVRFLKGLIAVANAAMPFLKAFGDIINERLFRFGETLSNAANSPGFQKWLQDMAATLQEVFDLLGALVEFIASFADQLNKSGGQEIIQTFTKAFHDLALFFASDAGQKAMQELVKLAILSIETFTGLIIVIGFLLAGIQVVVDFLGNSAIPSILKFLETLGGGFVHFFAFLAQKFVDFLLWLRSLPEGIKRAIGNLGGLLLEAGRNLIDGLINGIKARIPSLSGIMHGIAQTIRNFVPFSPAKEGPLSGSGDMLYAGQKIVQRLADGIHMEIPTIRSATNEATSNIVFGRGAIQVGFNGALPTPQQAEQTGLAVGSGINSQLTARNVRIAVRTL